MHRELEAVRIRLTHQFDLFSVVISQRVEEEACRAAGCQDAEQDAVNRKASCWSNAGPGVIPTSPHWMANAEQAQSKIMGALRARKAGPRRRRRERSFQPGSRSDQIDQSVRSAVGSLVPL